MAEVVSLLSDMQISVGSELKQIIAEAVEQASFNGIAELSYLALAAREPYMSDQTRDKVVSLIKDKIESLQGRRLALQV